MNKKIQYYRESNGDYLVVWFYNGRTVTGLYDARAAAIAGNPYSVCSTSVSGGFLRGCRKVDHRSVPRVWRNRMLSEV